MRRKLPGLGDLVLWAVACACVAASIYAALAKGGSLRSVALAGAGMAAAWLLVLASKRLSREAKNTIAAVLLSVAAALYAGETYFTYAVSAEPRLAYPPTHDRRSMREVVTSLREHGDSRAVPIIYPSYLLTRPDLFAGKQLVLEGEEVLPLAGISGRTTVLCNESGYWAIYRSDEHGFRNPPGSWSAFVDIAVVGDSFSNGNCVNDGEDWVSRVRSRYPRTLNLGMGGNGPLYELATIKEYLAQVRPKVVIWEYFEANETRISAEENVPMLKRYLAEPRFRQGLVSRQKGIDAILDQVVDQALETPKEAPPPARFQLSNFLRLVNLRARLRLQLAPPRPTMGTLSQALVEAKGTVSGWGGTLYFLYLPSALGLTSETPPAHYASHEEIVDLARRIELPVIDLYPALKAHPDPLSLFPYRGHFHYNVEGYRLVAEEVLERLRRDGAPDRSPIVK